MEIDLSEEAFSVSYHQQISSNYSVIIDRRHTYILHTNQVGNLLPWNAFVTAQPYYQARFCNTQFSNSFENFFAAFFTASQPVGLYLVYAVSAIYFIAYV